MYSLPLRGLGEPRPVNRMCMFPIGRGYYPHGVEMGRPVGKSVEVPLHFSQRQPRIRSDNHFQGLQSYSIVKGA